MRIRENYAAGTSTFLLNFHTVENFVDVSKLHLECVKNASADLHGEPFEFEILQHCAQMLVGSTFEFIFP